LHPIGFLEVWFFVFNSIYDNPANSNFGILPGSWNKVNNFTEISSIERSGVSIILEIP